MRWFTNAGEMVLDGSEKEGDVLWIIKWALRTCIEKTKPLWRETSWPSSELCLASLVQIFRDPGLGHQEPSYYQFQDPAILIESNRETSKDIMAKALKLLDWSQQYNFTQGA